ncbi:HMG-box, partial [Lichtheimia hyalospora FSU 10163]
MIHASTSSKAPRPMNCFFAFRLEKQREIIDRCPGANHRDISKIIAKWWKSMPDEEKEPYRVRARLAKNEHAKRYPNYKYQPQKRQGK